MMVFGSARSGAISYRQCEFNNFEAQSDRFAVGIPPNTTWVDGQLSPCEFGNTAASNDQTKSYGAHVLPPLSTANSLGLQNPEGHNNLATAATAQCALVVCLNRGQ